VRDTGIGMSEDVRRRVFERYYQADLRERKSQAGNGLGLAIARWIADAHHAELTVESVPLHSSVFQVKFPAPMGLHSAAPSASGALSLDQSPAAYSPQYLKKS
jgi:two-component system, OmpR family, heavy metal sensor histidine kinase CusS